MFDRERRGPVWRAMARLFVETDWTHARLREVAQVLDDSGYSRGELREIFENEVAPVCYTHLFSMRSRAKNLRDGWLDGAIVDHCRRRRESPRWWPYGRVPSRLGVEMTRSEWQQVLRLVGRLRRDPRELARHLNGSTDPSTLVRIIDNLRLLGERARVAGPRLVEMLGHRGFRVRCAAVKAAARVCGVEALDPLLDRLVDPSPTVRSSAIASVHWVLDEVVATHPDGTDGSLSPTPTDRIMNRVGDRALETICTYLREGRSRERVHAARIVEHLGPFARRRCDVLMQRFGDRNEAVRRAIADAVVAVDPDPEETLEHLRVSLFESCRRVRQTAALTLAGFMAAGDTRYFPAMHALRQALDDESPRVRQGAAIAIGWMGKTADEAVPRLAELARSDNPAARSAALFALGRMEDAALDELPSLAAALEDDHPEVRRSALRAFRRLGPLVRPMRPQFERLLADPDWLTQFEARRTLEAVRDSYPN